MNTRLLFSLLGLAALGACANSPGTSAAGPAPSQPQATATTTTPPGAVLPAPAGGLTEDVLYALLLGEIAGQRGEPGLALEAYEQVALKTRDPRIVKRAVELAVRARAMDDATRLAQLWVDIDPDAYKARQILVPLLISQERYTQVMPHLKAMLAMKERPAALAFMHLQSTLGRYRDKAAVLAMVRELAGGYEGLPEAHYAVAQAALEAENASLAEQSLDRALVLRPGWEAAALLRGQAFQQRGDAAVLDYWQQFLRGNPEATEVRMAYAKSLAKAGRYQEARNEFAQMNKKAGNPGEINYAIGLLSLQVDDLDGAEQSLTEALKQGYHDDETIRLYLAQIHESRQRYDEALKRYDEIGTGPRYLDARIKSALLLGKMKRLAEARSRLEQLKPSEPSERVRVYQAEAQLLRDGGDLAGAFGVLDRAVQAMPDSGELLYDRAMAAEKIDRLDVLEADLRRLIKLDPEHAHAYNALGYTLADRTNRVAEAIGLIEQALKIAPDDPFIQDSMGWALFKSQRFAEAETYLRRAYELRADPEIAAHLGEVLWRQGRRDEARTLWESAARKYPENDVLRETMARLAR